MKRHAIRLLGLWALACALLAGGPAGRLTVMTFNIRYANPSDGIYSWKNRIPLVAHVLRASDPDLAGFQEALRSQVDNLAVILKDWAWSGVGRDDGRAAGEFSAVFFRRARFRKLDGGTFWLSETPEVAGSRSWEAACNRIVTWVRLEDTLTGKTLFFFNTHFDHASPLAREKSAALLTERVAKIAGGAEVLVTGDFNEGRGSRMYAILTTGPAALQNTADLAIEPTPNPDYTFVGFPFQPRAGEAIDFVFGRNLTTWRPLRRTVVTYNVDGKYPSDHLPVVTEFVRAN